MNKQKKDMMILAGSIIVSMAAGFAIGCIKEKMMGDCKCIIDEL